VGLTNGGDTFISAAGVLPVDLDLQMELMAALLTDPGYRPEGEVPFRQSVDTMFAQSISTPAAALVSQLGGILSMAIRASPASRSPPIALRISPGSRPR
jgi:zinc protease